MTEEHFQELERLAKAWEDDASTERCNSKDESLGPNVRNLSYGSSAALANCARELRSWVRIRREAKESFQIG